MILVDSDVLIAHLRGVDAARQWLIRARTESGPLSISTIAIAEVAGGMRSPERREVARLLTSLRPVPVTERIAWQAAEFTRAHRRSNVGIGLGDYLVAATAHVQGLDLATLNTNHVPLFEGLAAPFDL
jgi:predicted nucleic acid-binding protein